jgi:7,8-dihydropterin-6-yl-methyl-4-(beta-D-ribofuranosyl)aminobenzene 5'-phosphate synthase
MIGLHDEENHYMREWRFMIEKFSATILVDDQSDGSALKNEHGFSVWIEADEKRILFDTGQSDASIYNAERLGISLHLTDQVILSHGHYDHTGGLPELVKRNPSLFVFSHPDVFMPRYSRQFDGKMKPIGISREAENALNQVDKFNFSVTAPIRLSGNIGISGPVPRVVRSEDTGGAFFLDPLGKNPDPIHDDMAMWFSTAEGLIIVTGCCHSGLMNTVKYIQSLNVDKSLYAIIGGFHLSRASAGRLRETCDFLQSTGVRRIMPCHCTGENATEALETRFGQKIKGGKTGARFFLQ